MSLDTESLNYDDTGSIDEEEEEEEEAEEEQEAEEETFDTPASRGRGRPPKGGKGGKRASTATAESSLPFEDTMATIDSISPFPTNASPLEPSSTSTSAGRGRGRPPRSASSVRDGAKGRAEGSIGAASSSSSSSSSPAKKGSSKNTTMDTDGGGDDDDGYGGGAAYDDDDYQAGGGGYDDDDAPAPSPSPAKQPSPVKAKSKAVAKDSKRRVSFGDGTKDVDSSSSKKVGRGKQAARTPDSTHSNTTTPESTGSVATIRTNISTPGSHEFTRGRQIPDESFRNDDDDDDDDDEDTDEETNHIDDSFIQKAIKAKSKKRYLDDEDDEDEDDGEDGPPGMRRSRRATKGQKFEFWKGERTVYQAGKLVGVLHALPTPAKPKSKAKAKPKSNGQKQKGSKRPAAAAASDDDDDDEEAEFEGSPSKRGRGSKEPSFKVPSDLRLIPRETGDELEVWDDSSDKVKTMKTVCYTESLRPPSELPITAIRPPGKDKVGFAAQSFNIPEIAGVMSSWISGFVELPAGAIKDAEGVGECAQVFFISDCQDGSGAFPPITFLSPPPSFLTLILILWSNYSPPPPSPALIVLLSTVELGIADPSKGEWDDDAAQRQLLKKGDSFYVPPGNIYRLENHSEYKTCMIHWCIIKPLEQPQQRQGGAGVDQDL